MAVCAVVGYGPGIGDSTAMRFARAGYKVGLVARTESKLAAAASKIPGCSGYVGDVTDPTSLRAALDSIEQSLGPIDVLVYNAGVGMFKSYDRLSLAQVETSMRTSFYGLFTAAQAVCPGMEARGSGVVIVTGATASRRGKPSTAAFAAAKAAQRSFSQSLARQLGPKNVHVALAVIDGVVGTAPGNINPDAIAETYFHLARQDASCWTFELEVRPRESHW
mmetsp:Transcript_22857/g.71638  ORF Transcript_22857/g.71638 Transcript_22857/m.71638 type:complete len:221 (-) Transcript_22857:96-758(-)